MTKNMLALLLLLLPLTSFAQKGNNKMPQYPGGLAAVSQYLSDNIVYPEEAQKQNIEGQVLLKLIIDSLGNVTDVLVMKSVHPLLDSEAVRVARKMPKWEPAIKDGKPAKAWGFQPILFKLED